MDFDYRGPNEKEFKYFYPIGYKDYGLNVGEKYFTSNPPHIDSDWLAMDGNDNEWAILYHGT